VDLLVDYFRARDAAAAAVVDGPEWAGQGPGGDDLGPADGIGAGDSG